MTIFRRIIERLTGRRHVDVRRLADDLFSDEGDRRRERERLEAAKIVRQVWDSPAVQQLAIEVGLTEEHIHDVYRRLVLHGDLRMAHRAISNVGLLRWYYEHGGRVMRLGPDEAIQLFMFARDGRLE